MQLLLEFFRQGFRHTLVRQGRNTQGFLEEILVGRGGARRHFVWARPFVIVNF